MKHNTYNIIISGKLLGNIAKNDAIEKFAETFKLSRETAGLTLNQAPKVIKTGIEGKQAKKYLNALKKIGWEATAKPTHISSARSSAVPANPAEAESAGDNFGKPSSHERRSAPSPSPSNSAVPPGNHNHRVDQPENPPGLQFRIDGKPDYAFLTVQVPAKQTLQVEASSMATMDPHLTMKTKFRGGLGRFLTGESLFINQFTAEHLPGEIGIAPGAPGDLTHRYLNNDTLFLQNSAYVASAMGVKIETKWQGLVKGFFSGESLFLIRCSGEGDLWFNTYGGIIEIDIDGEYVVDTGNIVAFTDGLAYTISKVGGYKSLFFSGEGFVCRFSGSGKVWIQTRNPSAFAQWAHWFRPLGKA